MLDTFYICCWKNLGRLELYMQHTHTWAWTHACTHMSLHIPHNKVIVTVKSLNLASIFYSDSNLAWAEIEVSKYQHLSDTRMP